MKILLCQDDVRDATAWLAELRAALPRAQVDLWRPGLPAVYELALVWRPPQQLLDEQTRLRAVLNLGAGVDALLALRLAPGLQVLRLEDAGMGVQMAEYVCHALIRFFREFDVYAAQQQRGLWQPRALRARGDFPVGIMGLGVLGAQVARAVRAFDFPVLGWSRTPRALDGVRCLAGAGELPEFLAATRVLVTLLPLTPHTRGILDRSRLTQLPRGSYLINLARGALVVEDDLRALLDDGQLAGATLDVMCEEPLPPDHWMWSHPAVQLTPHISGMTLRGDTIVQVARAVEALQGGGPLPGLVDRARGY
ncbi:MAG TPA: glyoxylate/hydroxypyruvate reductase A [Ottowia sp.]|uniref:2-hydroxyacid dehydrogenase n=1 Tax=Ottowia sp. TaxID=1898956 RepID=UPI002C0894D5|nr:glyoxylate/hydroxypyruvate reductase A [Ottowia sp.]HMN22178.1 glyoxylate/hydroxypyruvate reductase A [Ottowia sp.]